MKTGKQVASLVRAELTKKFPSVKFIVRIWGGHLRINWDGKADSKKVNAAVMDCGRRNSFDPSKY